MDNYFSRIENRINSIENKIDSLKNINTNIIDERLEGLEEIIYTFIDTLSSNPERLLSVKQAAELIGVSERSIHRWIATGKLPGFKFGNNIRVKVGDINKIGKPIDIYMRQKNVNECFEFGDYPLKTICLSDLDNYNKTRNQKWKYQK